MARSAGSIAATLAGAALISAVFGAASAQSPETCPARLALAEVKLASDIERSDAQVYLMRLELSVTKRQLAAALAKCGAACAPTATAAP